MFPCSTVDIYGSHCILQCVATYNCVEECVGGRGRCVYVTCNCFPPTCMYVYIATRIATTTLLCGIPRCVGACVGYKADASPDRLAASL